MKKLFCLLLALCMLCAAGCSNGAPDDIELPVGMLYTENKLLGVAFCYPAAWKISENDGVSDEGMITLLKDTSDQPMVSTYANITVIKNRTPAKDYNEMWEEIVEKEYKEQLKNYTSVKQDKIKVDGIEGGLYHFTADMGKTEASGGNTTYHFVQAIFVGAEFSYTVTLTATEEDYEQARADFDAIMQNFYFN